jgi:uncharacterized protein (TIGR02246 family)
MNNDEQSQSVVELTAEDRCDIQELISEFNFHEDAGNAEAWTALFTVDGCFVPPGKQPIEGRQKLLEHATHRATEKLEAPKQHWSSNVVIRRTSDGAEVRSYQMTTGKHAGGNHIRALAVITDELRRENGKWRLHLRRIVPFGVG